MISPGRLTSLLRQRYRRQSTCDLLSPRAGLGLRLRAVQKEPLSFQNHYFDVATVLVVHQTSYLLEQPERHLTSS